VSFEKESILSDYYLLDSRDCTSSFSVQLACIFHLFGRIARVGLCMKDKPLVESGSGKRRATSWMFDPLEKTLTLIGELAAPTAHGSILLTVGKGSGGVCCALGGSSSFQGQSFLRQGLLMVEE
jgi:hypothetical protein